MRIRLAHRPSYAQAYCILDRGESLLVERDGMSQRSEGMLVSAGFGPGGIGKALKRRMFGGESLIMGCYTAELQDAWIAVSPRYPGDMAVVDLDLLSGRGVVCEQGAVVAVAGPSPHHDGVMIDAKWSGLNSVLLREGITMLRLSGTGLALIGSYGGIEDIALRPGETRIIDTGHLVAYTDDTNVTVGTDGSVAATTLTGEKLVAHVTGSKDGGSIVWTQTRSEQGLTGWLFPEKRQNDQ